MRYGRLLDIGRGVVESKVDRSPADRLRRRLLRLVIPYRARFGALLKVGQFFRPVLPGPLKAATPPKVDAGEWPAGEDSDEPDAIEPGGMDVQTRTRTVPARLAPAETSVVSPTSLSRS